MLGSSISEALALVVCRSSSSNQGKKERSKCEHYGKMAHTKNKCRDLHGKLPDYKHKQRHGTAATTSTEDQCSKTESSPFTKEQLEALQKILIQDNLSQNSDIGTSSLAQKGNTLNAFAMPKEKSGLWIVD